MLSFYTVELETLSLLETISGCSKKLKWPLNSSTIFCADGKAEQRRVLGRGDGGGAVGRDQGGGEQRSGEPDGGPVRHRNFGRP